jgi:hypothetical protein
MNIRGLDNIFKIRVMMFNATFNNISVISWRSVLLVEETGVPGENHRPVPSYWQIIENERLFKCSHCLCINFPSARACMKYIYQRWHDIPEPVFALVFLLRVAPKREANDTLWSLRILSNYDLFNRHGYCLLLVVKSEFKCCLKANKGDNVLNLFYFFYALLTMAIVCIFVFSLLTITFSVFLWFLSFNNASRIFERLLICGYQAMHSEF